MRPVNLMPSGGGGAAAASREPRAASRGMVGGLALAGVATIAIVAYFAMARVDSIHSEADALVVKASEHRSQAQVARTETKAIGEPAKDSDQELASGAQSVLVAAYTERYDFVLMARELRSIMEGTGGWYETVETTNSGDSHTIKLVGYMPSSLRAAAFDDRVEATRTLTDADVVAIESQRLQAAGSKREGRYWKFTVTARLVDTTAPFAAGGRPSGSGDMSLVGDGGELELSLDPAPASRSKGAAKPANAFDAAALVAGGGS